MANLGQVFLNTAKKVKEKRDAKEQARAEKQKQDAQNLTEKLLNEPYEDPFAKPKDMPKGKELTTGEKIKQNYEAAELAEADRKKNAEAFGENPLNYTVNEVVKPAVEKGVENLKDNLSTSMKDAVSLPTVGQTLSKKDATSDINEDQYNETAKPSENANMTFNELADKLGIDPNNPTPEGQAALKEWLAANPDYKAGDLTNAYLNKDVNANMTFKELADKLGIDPNNPTPEGQKALQEWLDANPDYKAGDLTNAYLNKNGADNVSSNTELPYEDFQKMLRDYKKEYALPKNGADYLKSLWKAGKGGKAAAIGNVLGNLLGAGGYGLAGKEYTTDWEDYKNRYLDEASRREGEQFDRASGLTQRMFENRQDVDKMIDSLDKEVAFARDLSEADKLAWTSFKQAQNAGDWKTILTMLATGKLGKIGNMVEDWWSKNATGNPMSMFNQGAK
jgi:hypothetical protein